MKELRIPYPKSSLDEWKKNEDKVIADILIGKPKFVSYNFVPGNLTIEDINMLPETAWAGSH